MFDEHMTISVFIRKQWNFYFMQQRQCVTAAWRRMRGEIEVQFVSRSEVVATYFKIAY